MTTLPTQTGTVTGWIVLSLAGGLTPDDIRSLQFHEHSMLYCPMKVIWKVLPKHLRRAGSPNRVPKETTLFEGYAFYRPAHDDALLAALGAKEVYSAMRTMWGYSCISDEGMERLIEATAEGQYDQEPPRIADPTEDEPYRAPDLSSLMGTEVKIARGPHQGKKAKVVNYRSGGVDVRLRELDCPVYIDVDYLLSQT